MTTGQTQLSAYCVYLSQFLPNQLKWNGTSESLLFRISVTKQLSGVMQVPRRCPAAVRSGAEIGLLSLRRS